MVWSGFRPSDDQNTYGFNIPGNMYAWAAIQRARALNAQYWQDDSLEALMLDLSTTIRYPLPDAYMPLRCTADRRILPTCLNATV
jgi:meiotically up-regulated gene 157 (Mug157) protein